MYSEKSVNEIFPGLFDFSFVREKGAFNAELTRIKNAGGPKNTAPEPSRAEMRRLDEPDWEMMGSGTPEEIGRRYGKMGRGGSGYDR